VFEQHPEELATPRERGVIVLGNEHPTGRGVFYVRSAVMWLPPPPASVRRYRLDVKPGSLESRRGGSP
jgi:hypothetical protein